MFKFLKKIFTEKVEEPQRKEPIDSIVTSDKSKNRALVINKSDKEQQPTIETYKDSISIAISSIILGFSDKLKAEIIKKPSSSETFKIPVEKILPQIQTGAVKITFGELKKTSPPGIFSTNYSLDNEIVYLPLKEIIPKLSASHFKIQSKKEQTVPDEIADIFGGQKVDNKVKPISAKISETTGVSDLSQQKPIIPEKQEQLKPPEEPVQKQPAVTTPEEPLNVISIKLNSLISYLKPEIVEQIQTLKLSESLINIPVKELEPLIKSGKVIYSWGKIYSWLSPLPQSTPSSPDITFEIPLKVIAPLFLSKVTISAPKKTLTLIDTIPDIFTAVTSESSKSAEATPLRMASESVQSIEEKTKPLQQPDESIQQPQLASQIQPSIDFHLEKEVIPKEKPSTKYEVKSLSELFDKPGKTKWTPNEVIQCTMNLPGINGAMISLKEGLPVAYKLPDNFNPDVFAALLPQIFSRVSGLTSEFQLGSLTNLTFECNDTKIFVCVSENIYFVVLGKRSEALPPSIQLQEIVNELVKQNKN